MQPLACVSSELAAARMHLGRAALPRNISSYLPSRETADARRQAITYSASAVSRLAACRRGRSTLLASSAAASSPLTHYVIVCRPAATLFWLVIGY
ncbi:hypothetical protein BHM03_00034112 [Ensete ventricosum]|nr:hypothetical protein BHM03_00034112 [Ensete ventricosum]